MKKRGSDPHPVYLQKSGGPYLNTARVLVHMDNVMLTCCVYLYPLFYKISVSLTACSPRCRGLWKYSALKGRGTAVIFDSNKINNCLHSPAQLKLEKLLQ